MNCETYLWNKYWPLWSDILEDRGTVTKEESHSQSRDANKVPSKHQSW